MKLFLLLLFCHVSSPEKHSLEFFTTSSSGISNFPEFIGSALIDGVEQGSCDSDRKKVEVKQDRAKEVFKNLDWFSKQCEVLPTLFKAIMYQTMELFNQTGDRPSVSLLQKSSSSPVSCFATGFYPNKAVLFWRKGGDDLHDNVEEGQILPNPDGTFQKSSDLDLSSVRPEDWGKYECVFQLDGLNDDIITKLDQSGIRTNSVPVPPSEFPVGPVVGGVVGLLLLTACICGLLIWRRRVHGYQRGLEVDTELE
ncbi:major histocompatibility complex class I-related gene protein-like isoform X2 [Echeneis naucrates]|uniref:major histocompatibility complex class I-related gene protein-like isoform X2 n=1 Tax=Echeneis naucrates TaxID=173247 RepID=UPI00111406F3|nr:major histocompatibility complex class I-related gene protein-like isoform X2 [Echeneis naucrates]